MRKTFFPLVLAAMLGTAAGQSIDPTLHRASYGPAEQNFGELTVPRGAGPFPVAVLLHGGCWKSTAGRLEEMQPMASLLASHAIASWNVEYRRPGHAGAGWPGTFRDVSDATDYVRELGRRYPLDVQRVIVVGHSSGGYFAAWIAGRHRLPPGSGLVGPQPLKVTGLVVLDAFLDPRVIDSRGTDGSLFCGEPPVLPRLIGGEPELVPDRLRQASPLALLPFGIPQEYVVKFAAISSDTSAAACCWANDVCSSRLPRARESCGRLGRRLHRT